MRLALLTFLVGCANTSGVRARASSLETEAESCESFGAFEERLATVRQQLSTAPGDDLVPASTALSSARRRCAEATVAGLFERQEKLGRDDAAREVQALTAALGADETLRLLRSRWGDGAETFASEVALAAFKPGPTPAQPTPTEPIDPSPRPSLPGPEAFGEGPACLRLSTMKAAECLGQWRRDGADDAAFEPSLATFVRQAREAVTASSEEARAEQVATLLQALAQPRGRPVLEPLFKDLERSAEVLLGRARSLHSARRVEEAASTVRPLLLLDAERRRAEPFIAAASSKHERLAQEAGQRVLAARVHRHLAGWFRREAMPAPRLEPGRWSDARWDCPLRKPPLPPLADGVAARLVVRCRTTANTPPSQPADPSLRTFELEASLKKVRIDAEVNLVCGGAPSSTRLTVEELQLDDDVPADDTRPHPLSAPLERFVEATQRACVEGARVAAAQDCRRDELSPLDRTQLFTRWALRLGDWPRCYADWFRATYGVPPPPLGT